MPDPNVYNAPGTSPAAWTNTGPLFQLIAPASATAGLSKSAEILRVSVTIQLPAAPTAAQLSVQLKVATGAWTSTSPTAITPFPYNAAERVTGTLAKCTTSVVSVSSTDGSGVLTAYEDGFNELGGFLWLPSPRETITVASGQFFLVDLAGTVSSSTFKINVVWREY